ncbi:MAG: sigma-70 family RNA polymerase sigma factor [Candidatus Eremiobacteraeota bacterium]|nr:sigma-70 family RNA polymerase sigma factor [Candidatus Eremiobacteraeota bacterium]
MIDIRDVREANVRALFPLVKKIARRIYRLVPGSDIDDLIGEGSVGLIRAVDSYDASRGPTLESYASRIIAGAMLNGVRRLDPVSERVRREIREAERERYALASQRGELPTQLEMEQRRPALRRATVHLYRHAPLSLDGPLPSSEFLKPDESADPALVAAGRHETERLRRAVESLSPRYRRLLALHYFGEQSLHQIGRTFAISPQRASQLHLAALRQLRKHLDVVAAR